MNPTGRQRHPGAPAGAFLSFAAAAAAAEAVDGPRYRYHRQPIAFDGRAEDVRGVGGEAESLRQPLYETSAGHIR